MTACRIRRQATALIMGLQGEKLCSRVEESTIGESDKAKAIIATFGNPETSS